MKQTAHKLDELLDNYARAVEDRVNAERLPSGWDRIDDRYSPGLRKSEEMARRAIQLFFTGPRSREWEIG
jgi:hypothetical protein